MVPSSQQAAFFAGSATDGVQRWGASLALTVLFSKVGREGAACWAALVCTQQVAALAYVWIGTLLVPARAKSA